MADHDPIEGIFIGSELGTSYRCKCGWTSERFALNDDVAEAAVQHAIEASKDAGGEVDR